MHAPLILATQSLRQRSMWRNGKWSVPSHSAASPSGSSAQPAMSPPAPNQSPVPVRHTASSSGWRSAQIAARLRPRYMSCVNALRRSTRSTRRCSTRLGDVRDEVLAPEVGSVELGASLTRRRRPRRRCRAAPCARRRRAARRAAPGVVARPLAGRARPGVLARRVRVVALEQDVVGVLRDGVERDLLLEPEAAVDLAPEVLARQQVVLGVLVAHAAVAPLPVEGLERGRDPADARLDRHQLQVGEAVAHAAEDQVGDAAHVVDEDHRRDLGEVRHPAHAGVVAELRAHRAAADVEADRDAGLLRRRPHRVPVRVRERRLAVVLRLVAEVHRPVAELDAALQLG